MPPLATSKWDELTRHTIFYNDPLSRSRHHPRLPAAHRLEARREQRNIAERDQYKTRFADVQLPLAAFHFDQHGYGNGTCTDTLHNWACSSWLVKRPRLRRTIYGFLLMFIFFILVALNWAGWQKSNWTNRAPLLTFDFTQFSATDQQQAAHASISLFDTGATDISQQYHIYFTHWCATSNNVTRVSSDGSQPPDWPAKDAVICGERHLGVPDLLKEWHLETDVTELQSTDATSASFFEAFGQWMGVVSRLVALALVCISVVVLAEIVRVVIQFWRSWIKRCFCCLEIDREPSDGRDVGPTEAAWALKCKPAGCGRRTRRMCCSFDILCCYDPLSVQYRAYLAGHGKYDHYADAEERYNNVRRLYLGYLRKSMFLHVMQCLLVLICLLAVLLAVTFTTAIIVTVPGIRSEWALSGIRIPHDNVAFMGLGIALAFLPFLFATSILNAQLEMDKYRHVLSEGDYFPSMTILWILSLLEPCFCLLCACRLEAPDF